jgi:hypothetical protein
LVVGFGLLTASGAVAQERDNTYFPRPVQSPPLVQHRASTYEEGVLRGWADVGRSVGEARYNTALALVHREEAIRRRLENRKQAVEDYFQIRRFNKNMRFQTVERPTQEELSKISASRLPNRMSGDQYQPTTGAIVWPNVLRSETFAEQRAAINNAMARRTLDNSGVGSANYQQVRALTAKMKSQLQEHAAALSSAETIAARKFLASLNYEVQFPMAHDIAGLAIR